MTKLPTFRLDVSKFIVETLRLRPDLKGAYLMLLLDYCSTGEPPPDNANVLAQIAGVDGKDWDEEYADLIRPLFDVRDGRWYHTEIEAELARAKKVADNAHHAASKAAEALAKKRKKAPAPKPLAFQAEAAIREELGPRRAAAPTTTVAHIGKAPPPPEPELPAEEPPPDVMPIPDDFALDGSMLIQCRNSGVDMDDIAGWLDYFRSYNMKNGTLSDDWTAAWWRYFDRKIAEKNKPAKPAKPAPRIEVSRRVAPPPS